LSDAWTRCQPCRPGTATRTPHPGLEATPHAHLAMAAARAD
jgi:hypothetical protein